MGVDYRILGSLEALRDGEPLELGGAKQRTVLALLLVNLNRLVTTDALVEALWPDKPPGKPRTSIQGYVSHLRKALAPEHGFEVIVTEPAGYRLQVVRSDTDLGRFEELVRSARNALGTDRADEASTALTEGLALFRGSPLADFAYTDWARVEIDRIEELRLACLEDRIEADLALGRHAELVGELEALVALHPLREMLRGQLMLALYRSGRQAEALDVYSDTREALVEQLGIDPSPELQALYRQFLNQDASLAAPAQRPSTTAHNLPAPPDSLVGRVRELAELEALLERPDVRLVTLTGPGGAGKTRLALELASDMLERFPDGAWWVPLQALDEPELVETTIAATLGASGDLAQHLAGKHLLLLLDNMEHLVDASPAIARLLEATASLRLVVTSREPLRIAGERLYPVEQLEDDDAVALFVARATVAEPLTVVHEICQRLDYLPLALELAAARTTVLTPEALLSRLDQALPLLTTGRRDVPDRQRTLHNTIEWSHRLLTPTEQELFAKLAVFTGSFDLEAAEAICDAALDTLQSLIEKSLLRRWETGRFLMLQTIREFADACLATTTAKKEHLQRRHAAHYWALAEEAEFELRGRHQRSWRLRLELDHHNIRAAIAWAKQAEDSELGLRFGAALWRFWRTSNNLGEGIRTLDIFLATEDANHELRAKALVGASRLAMDSGEHRKATALGEQALTVARIADSAAALAAATENLGLMLLNEGLQPAETATSDLIERAVTLLEDGVGRFRALGDRVGTADALNNLGNALINSGQPAEASKLLEEALTLQREAQNAIGLAFVLNSLGNAYLYEGDLDSAQLRLEEALRLYEELGDLSGIGETIEALAILAAAEGKDDRAAILWGASETIRAETGNEIEAGNYRNLYNEAVAGVQARLDPSTWKAAWTHGATLKSPDAVATALSH